MREERERREEACRSSPVGREGLALRLRGRLTGRGWPTSLHRSTLPNTTCNPSKKLSPMIMTVAPPVVQPSPGLMALMQGVAAGRQERTQSRGCTKVETEADQGWAGSPDLQKGPGVGLCVHAWSCYAQTCCPTQPAHGHPHSRSWTPPPVCIGQATLAGTLGSPEWALLGRTSTLRWVTGGWNSESP